MSSTGLSQGSSSTRAQSINKTEKLLRSIEELQSGRHSAFGVFGYKTPKAGLPIKNPLISFTKDRCKNFLEGVQKRAKKTPGPPEYFKPLVWPSRNHSVKMKLDSKRLTFTDEIIKITKEIPASNHYQPKKTLPKVTLGKSE